jgi:hypothetical protein
MRKKVSFYALAMIMGATLLICGPAFGQPTSSPFQIEFWQIQGGTVSFEGGTSPLIGRDMILEIGNLYLWHNRYPNPDWELHPAPFRGGTLNFETGPYNPSSGFGDGGYINITYNEQIVAEGVFEGYPRTYVYEQDGILKISFYSGIGWDHFDYVNTYGPNFVLPSGRFGLGPFPANGFPNSFETSIYSANLTAQPVPGSVLLLGSGLLGLVGWRRFRKG